MQADETSDDEHRRQEHQYWQWSNRLYAATLVATIVAAVFGGFAFQEARKQANAALAAQRPWIKVLTTLKGSTRLDFPGGYVDVANQVENVGHSPAVDVRIGTWAYIGRSYDSGLFDFLRKTCRGLSARPALDQEQRWTVFPGEHRPWNGSLGSAAPGYSADDVAKLAVVEDGRRKIPITFVGCADYIDPFDGKHHQTSFVYTVDQLVNSLGELGRTPFVDTTAPVPANQLLLEQIPGPADMTN